MGIHTLDKTMTLFHFANIFFSNLHLLQKYYKNLSHWVNLEIIKIQVFSRKKKKKKNQFRARNKAVQQLLCLKERVDWLWSGVYGDIVPLSTCSLMSLGKHN